MPHSVTICIKYRHGWIRAYILCPFVERLFLSPAAHSQIVVQQSPMPKCAIIVSQLVAFFTQCFFFNIFFIGCDPQMYTAGGHLVLIWSPPRLLYHTWLLIRSRTPIRWQEWYNQPNVLVTVLHLRCIMYCLLQVGLFDYKHIRLMSRPLSLQPCCPHDDCTTHFG